MEMYSYTEAVRADVEAWIDENRETLDAMMKEYGYEEYIELGEYVSSKCECDDGVTGNASGSYYCNAWKAEESLCHNWDLLIEAADNMGYENILHNGPELCDMLIRCYLVPSIVQDVLEDMGTYEREEEEEE